MRPFFLFIGPAAGLLVALGLALAGHDTAVSWTAGVTVLCATWWISS